MLTTKHTTVHAGNEGLDAEETTTGLVNRRNVNVSSSETLRCWQPGLVRWGVRGVYLRAELRRAENVLVSLALGTRARMKALFPLTLCVLRPGSGAVWLARRPLRPARVSPALRLVRPPGIAVWPRCGT